MLQRLTSPRCVVSASMGLLICLLVCSSSRADENWPQWRGPYLSGVSHSDNLPTKWTGEENVAWKVSLPAWSGSTPIIWGDRVFVMTPSKYDAEEAAEAAQGGQGGRGGAGRGGQGGRGGGGQSGRSRFGRRGGGGRMGGPSTPGGKDLMLVCLSKKDGSTLWERVVDDRNSQRGKQNMSSPSPVTDGEHIWTLTGTGQVTAFDMEGNQKWQLNLQDKYGAFGLGWGYASSPLLFDGKLIIEVLHGQRTDDPSYVAAFNASTGEELWRQERPTDALNESPDAYTTPMVLEHGGKTQIIVSGGDYVTAHDPDTGRELWRSSGLNPERQRNYRVVPSPVITGELVVVPTRVRPVTAVRAGGSGDVSDTHIAWQAYEGGPDVPTPVTDGKLLYLVSERGGLVTCLDVKTGEKVWGPERAAEGTVSSSPLLAGGKLYLTNEKAETWVMDVSADGVEPISMNELDGTYTLSSIAVSGSQLFIRTSEHLYCIGIN